MNSKLEKINIFSRYGLAFVLFYHGLVPKMIWYSETERSLAMAFNINVPAPAISLTGGVIEILLAFAIIYFRKHLIPVYIAAVLMLALLIGVGLAMPELLIEAFNPVSTNIASLVLCYIVYLSQAQKMFKEIL